MAFEKPEGVPAVGKFSNTLRFFMKEVCSLGNLSVHLLCYFVLIATADLLCMFGNNTRYTL